MSETRPSYAVKSGPLSAAERAEINTLAERGLTSGQIAWRLRRHPATINNRLISAGLRAPGPDRRLSYERGGSMVRTFSAEEDAFIEALRIQGFTQMEIGVWCGRRYGHARTAATISMRLRAIAARETMDA